MQNLKDILFYRKAYQLTLDIYKIADKIPVEERQILGLKIKNTAFDIPINVSKCLDLKPKREYLPFMVKVKEDFETLKYSLMIAKDLEFIAQSEYESLITRIEEIIKNIS